MRSALLAALRFVFAEQRAEDPMQVLGRTRAEEHAMQKLGPPFGGGALAGALAQAEVYDD
jgi:ribulose 1,5-bisphosphate synthetase/thiazole synthase